MTKDLLMINLDRRIIGFTVHCISSGEYTVYITFFLLAAMTCSVVGLVEIPSSSSTYSVVRYIAIARLLRNVASLTLLPSSDPLNRK